MDTMFSLKVAQDPRLHFRQRKFQKSTASWFFFQGSFEKTQFSSVFHF